MATKLTKAQEHVLGLAADKKDLYGDCGQLGDYGGRRQTINALRKKKLIWSDGTLTEMGRSVALPPPRTICAPTPARRTKKEHAS